MLLNHYSKLLVISHNTTKIPLISNRYSTIRLFPPNKTKATPTVTIPLPHLYPPAGYPGPTLSTQSTPHTALTQIGRLQGEGKGWQKVLPYRWPLFQISYFSYWPEAMGMESCFTNFNLQGMEILKTSFNYYYSKFKHDLKASFKHNISFTSKGPDQEVLSSQTFYLKKPNSQLLAQMPSFCKVNDFRSN